MAKYLQVHGGEFQTEAEGLAPEVDEDVQDSEALLHPGSLDPERASRVDQRE